MAASTVALKISTEDETQDIRRISVNADITVSALRTKLAALFNKDLSQTKILYLDSDSELVTIITDEELSEAVRLAQLKETPVLNVTLRSQVQRVQPSVQQQQGEASPAAGAACDGCPVSKFFAKHCRPGAAGGGRRCCPGKIIKCALLAIFAFKIVSFLAFHFFWLAVLALPFIAIRAIRRRYQRRNGERGGCNRWAERCARVVDQVQQEVARHHNNSHVIRPEDVVPVNVPVASAPAPSAPVVEVGSSRITVVETGDAAGNINGASRFSKALTELENMGFVDKTKNIEALIATNLDLNRSIQRLLV